MAKNKEFEPEYIDIITPSSTIEVRENEETGKVARYLWKYTSWTPPFASYWDYYYAATSWVMVFYTEDWRI